MRGKKNDPNEIKFLETLKMLAPGTVLREALEYIKAAQGGALIVIGTGEAVLRQKDEGFRIDRQLIPSNLYELAKMDGAIILSEDAKKILFCNVILTPEARIFTTESGSRHRAAERMSKQTGKVTIAVSQRRRTITVYIGQIKYILKDPVTLTAKAALALQTLDKFQQTFLKVLHELTILEFRNAVTLADIALVIQKAERIHRIYDELERFITELGKEGRLISMQLNELLIDLDEELFLIKDYCHIKKNVTPDSIAQHISALSKAGKLNNNSISVALGLGPATEKTGLAPFIPRGYRLLRKLPNLPHQVVAEIVNSFGDLPAILQASPQEMDKVPGIGEVRSHNIVISLNRLKEQYLAEQ